MTCGSLVLQAIRSAGRWGSHNLARLAGGTRVLAAIAAYPVPICLARKLRIRAAPRPVLSPPNQAAPHRVVVDIFSDRPQPLATPDSVIMEAFLPNWAPPADCSVDQVGGSTGPPCHEEREGARSQFMPGAWRPGRSLSPRGRGSHRCTPPLPGRHEEMDVVRHHTPRQKIAAPLGTRHQKLFCDASRHLRQGKVNRAGRMATLGHEERHTGLSPPPDPQPMGQRLPRAPGRPTLLTRSPSHPLSHPHRRPGRSEDGLLWPSPVSRWEPRPRGDRQRMVLPMLPPCPGNDLCGQAQSLFGTL